MSIDWSKAPEGATHWHKGDFVRWTGKRSHGFGTWDMDAWLGGNWELAYWGWKGTLETFLEDGAIPRPTSTEKPVDQPKALTQAVFDGLPSEYRWAAYLDKDGDPVIFCDLEAEHDALFPDHKPDCYDDGLEWATWLDGVLWRTESITDVARSIEAARVEERKHGHYFKDVSSVAQIDVYAVLRLFEVTDPCLQHIVKKALCAGKRGAKDWAKDVQEIADTAQRLIELESGK